MPKVRIEDRFHELYRMLARDDASSGGRKTFDTMKDVFMLAMGFGLARAQRTPLGSAREIFDDNVLKDADWDIMRAAAIADSGDIIAVSDDAEVLKIGQEYANTGARVLEQIYQPAQAEQSLANATLSELELLPSRPT